MFASKYFYLKLLNKILKCFLVFLLHKSYFLMTTHSRCSKDMHDWA